MNLMSDKNLLEIFIKQKYYFPYEYIDSLDENIDKINCDDYHLYLVLSVDKLIIENVYYNVIKNIYQIVILNTITNEKTTADFNLEKYIDLNIPNYLLEFNIIDNSSALQIEFNRNALELIKTYNISKYYMWMSVDLNLKIHVSKLFDENNQSQMHKNSNLLYIGKSVNLKTRLLKHETILKAQRELIRKYPNKSLYIVMIQLNSKLISKTGITPFSQFITTNSRWLETNFASDINYMALVGITEAILINYFKPKYNTVFADSNPTFSKKTFKDIFKYNIQTVHISFDMHFVDDLYFKLNTKTCKTDTGFTIIDCKIKNNKEIIITSRPITEERYKWL